MIKKVIVVTGANRGIGKEICRQLAAMGHTVVLTARDLASAETIADELPGQVIAMKLDVRNDNSAWTLAEKIRQQFAHVDVLINNAGVMSRQAMRKFDLDDVKATLETNFFGALRTTKHLMPLLQASASPRVINVSSGMGDLSGLAEGEFAAYRLSKAALNAFTLLLSAELKTEPFRINAMCPGWVRTDMGGLTAPRSVAQGADTAVWLATEAEVPTGKFFRDRQEIPW